MCLVGSSARIGGVGCFERKQETCSCSIASYMLLNIVVFIDCCHTLFCIVTTQLTHVFMRLKEIQREIHCYDVIKLILVMGFVILPRLSIPKTSQIKYFTVVHETTKKILITTK